MRFRLFFLGLLGVLAACSKAKGPVRLDFVGYTGLTSSNRTVSAADSFRTHVFAQVSGNEPELKKLKITVTYSPEPEPVLYTLPLANFTPSTNSTTLTMLDSALTGQEFIFRPTFGARSTSGTERWEYTATNTADESTTRAYRLTVRKTDSTAVYHTYTVIPRMVPGSLARVYFALHPGLLLPRFAVIGPEKAENQQLVDLALTYTGGSLLLQAPSALPLPASWTGTRRATQLRRTALDGTAFNAVVTTADLATAFEGVTAGPTPQNSGKLALNDVIAFKTDAGKYGLIYISALALTPVPVLTCIVRIQK